MSPIVSVILVNSSSGIAQTSVKCLFYGVRDCTAAFRTSNRDDSNLGKSHGEHPRKQAFCSADGR